jgi:hypothetical protein
MWQNSQKSSTGLTSTKMREIDTWAPRPRLPPRALPDSVRQKMKLPPRDGAPAARRNWGEPPALTTKAALFGENANANRIQIQHMPVDGRRPSADEKSEEAREGRTRRVSANPYVPVEVSRVPKREKRASKGKAPSPYDTELQGGLRRMETLP